jgi:NADH-quinone oxidoreductase subunit N
MNGTAQFLIAAGCGKPDPVTWSIAGLCTAKGSISVPVNYPAIVPLLVLGGGALVVLVLASVLPKRRYRGLWSTITALTGVGTITDGIVQWAHLSGLTLSPQTAVTMGDQIFYDHFSAFFAILFGCATVLGAALADGYLDREGLDGPEAYVLMMTCSAGAVLMADAAGLISLFLGLEILSIALYTMSAYHRRRAASGEAGLKYFILGSFASAIFIYGAALIYGATGSTQYLQIVVFLADNLVVHNGVLLAGTGLVIVGLGFKVAAVPFHFWAPDVYQGAPTPFVGYMAAVAKAAGFAALLRVLMLALPTEASSWRPIIWVLATASVLVGSVLALVQVDLKRLLAYSSISQAGYVLIALQAGTAAGTTAMCFYLFTYMFMVMGTFAVVSILQGRSESRNDLSALRGLASRSPGLAAAMLVLVLGQAGMPLTSGFLGKWVVFDAAIAQRQYALALIGMLAAAIAAFMYLRIAFLMYSVPGAETPAPATGREASHDRPEHNDPDYGPDYGPDHDGPDHDGSDYETILIAGLPGRDTALALRAAPTSRLHVPVPTAAVLALCAAFTIFAGVSTPVLSLAHSIGLPWSA